MILDSLKSAPNYYNLNSRFKEAFDFIKKNDLNGMKPGKYLLDGENLFITIAEFDGKQADEAKLEAHKKYIDIQIVLSGQETMGWSCIDNCKNVIDPYNSDKDIIFFSEKPSTYLIVNPEEFAIYFPEDGHAPGISKSRIKKAIVKVLVETSLRTK